MSVLLCVVSLIVVSMFLRFFGLGSKYYVFPPNLNLSVDIPDKIIKGLDNHIHFTTNSLGLRGPEIPKIYSGKDYTILFIGGSTTECFYLDDKDTWPYLTMQNLNSLQSDVNVIAQNAGRAGYSTRAHIIFLECLLPQMDVACVVVLCGINDFALILNEKYRYDILYNPVEAEGIKRNIFWGIDYDTLKYVPFYKKSLIWQAGIKVVNFYKHIVFRNKPGQIEYLKRQQREKAVKVSIESDPRIKERINMGLNEYEANIKRMINICKKYNVRVIFVNQPVLWRENLTSELKHLLCFGKVEFLSRPQGDIYLNENDLYKIISMYNDKLKYVCVKENIEFIDLAGSINKETDNFYDDCHFTKKGAREVADAMTEYLKNKIP